MTVGGEPYKKDQQVIESQEEKTESGIILTGDDRRSLKSISLSYAKDLVSSKDVPAPDIILCADQFYRWMIEDLLESYNWTCPDCGSVYDRMRFLGNDMY